MTYELAKELKDAGFPLIKIEGGMCVGRQKVVDFNPEGIQNKDGMPNAQHFYEPTLSELIEACESFSSLTKSPRGTWYCARSKGSVEMVVGDEYSTPEEAVARLWLALNKK